MDSLEVHHSLTVNIYYIYIYNIHRGEMRIPEAATNNNTYSKVTKL